MLNLDHESKKVIKFLHDKHQSPLYKTCVLELEKKIKCPNIREIPRQKYQLEVRNALNILYDVEMLRPLLEIVAYLDVEISLDFESESVCSLDPTEGTATRGYYSNGKIVIGAKNLMSDDKKNLFLATLVHEMTHFVMDYLYSNSCNPFVPGDDKRLNDFKAVYAVTMERSGNEKIILDVAGYAEELKLSELIVRPNHLMAHYIDNEVMRKECEVTFSELFQFYKNRILVAIQERLEWMKNTRAEEDIEIVPLKRKRMDGRTHRDVEAQRLLLTDEIPMKPEFLKNRLWMLFLTTCAIVVAFCMIIMLIYNKSQEKVPLPMRIINPLCHNVDHPWSNFIATNNISAIESAEYANRNAIFRVNSTCNPVTMSIEKEDMDFVKDVLDVAEDVFRNCTGSFKRLLANSLVYLRDNCEEVGDIYGFISGKLEKLMDVKEHRLFVNGNFSEIGKVCDN